MIEIIGENEMTREGPKPLTSRLELCGQMLHKLIISVDFANPPSS